MPITFRLKITAAEAKNLGAVPSLFATSVDGSRYQLQHAFADLASAQRLAAKVLAKGSIDRSLWTQVSIPTPAAAPAARRKYPTPEQYRARHAREMGLAA
jgi:hypothetical protein